MNNKKFTNIISVLTLSAIMVTGGVKATAAADFSEETIYDNAPIVYVTSDNELPEAFRRRSENMKNVPYITPEKARAYNEFVNNKSLDDGIATQAVVYPSVRILQNPQDENYFCGYACLQSILEYHDIDKTQYEIATDAYRQDTALPWFAGTEEQATQWRRYPAAAYLSDELNLDYRPYSSYFGTFTSNELAEKIKYDVSERDEGVLICGVSKGDDSDGSRLPGYPTNQNIGHWIVADGYHWDIPTQKVLEITFVDPAKSGKITWSSSIGKYSHTELDRMYNFAASRGIIWCS